MSRETLILERSDLKVFSWATAENFVWNKNSSHSQEKLEKPVGGGRGEGGRGGVEGGFHPHQRV